MRELADRDDDGGRSSDGGTALLPGVEEDQELETALLAYARSSAARVGADWFEAEWARRDEQELRVRESTHRVDVRIANRALSPVDASVEDNAVEGDTGLGLGARPEG